MKITDYEKVQALAASNIFLLDGPNGTKTIAADALAKALIGLLSSKDFIGGVNLSELTQINGWYPVTNYSSGLRRKQGYCS